MIKKIIMKDVASFDKTGAILDLNKINYIFGSNGTGKTTISEFLRKPTDYPSCRVDWIGDNSNIDVYVYNRNFVQENFYYRDNIKGIFTLGEKSGDIARKIDKLLENIEKHKEKIDKLKGNMDKKDAELEDVKNEFMQRCWDLRKKYDESFKEAFLGVRSSKEKFMLKCIEEVNNNKGALYSFDKLKSRVESIFKGIVSEIDTIEKITYNNLYENSTLFETKIIGKEDIDIAELISKLNISDWVRQGYRHIDHAHGICPFCQQKLPSNFVEKLEEYFDETYNEQLRRLDLTSKDYLNEVEKAIIKIQAIIDKDIPFLNSEKVKHLMDLIVLKYQKNKQKIDKKREEPSSCVKLTSIATYVVKINEEIDEANKQIGEHNRIINNIESEKGKLIKDIWHYITQQNKDNYKRYDNRCKKINKAKSEMGRRLKELHEYLNKFESDVTELQNQLSSIHPSIDDINDLLKSFGFTNFKLIESEVEGNYKIIREDGKDANNNLSEGEMTFITFLYFYHLINGSNEKDRLYTERVIVIDDPISSLDNNVLFIVSHLVNVLKEQVRKGDSKFKQLIILTHNVYFHKEVSFNKGKGAKKLSDEVFMVLRKVNNISKIKYYEENPVNNSYELLWRELKENYDSTTVPNIMRRILENYFKFFGNINIDEIIEKLPDKDKIVGYSLINWLHNGSHCIDDDLFFVSNEETTAKYFYVFRDIFIFSNHKAHYDMMMGDFKYEFLEDVVDDIAYGETQESSEQVATSEENNNNYPTL